jgi:glycosyltransferase involved in cell wall biosynthesis
MSGSPEISVVMSVYNGVDKLPETIDSVLSQQGASLEFIVVDDGSTDGSDAIIGSYARHDPRIRILHQENQGLTRALIKGCDAAKGKYIARQDAGDISLPDRLRLLKAILDRYEDCAFVSSWTSVIVPKDEYLFSRKGKGLAASPIRILSKRSQKWVIIEGPTHHGSVMFRREAYMKAGGYRAAFYYAQDWDLWYRLATLGKFAIVGQPLYQARITPDSISSLSRARQATYARLSHKAITLRLSGHSDAAIVQETERLLPRKPHAIRRPDQAKAFYFIGRCLVNNKDPRATPYFFNAIASNPLLIRAWWWAALSLARQLSNRILTRGAHGFKLPF